MQQDPCLAGLSSKRQLWKVTLGKGTKDEVWNSSLSTEHAGEKRDLKKSFKKMFLGGTEALCIETGTEAFHGMDVSNIHHQ